MKWLIFFMVMGLLLILNYPIVKDLKLLILGILIVVSTLIKILRK